MFLLLFLRRKKLAGVRPLVPIEQMVADKVDVGDISWLPVGRDSSLEEEGEGTDEVTGAPMISGGRHGGSGGRSLATVEKQNSRILQMLEGLAASGFGGGGLEIDGDFDMDEGGDNIDVKNAISKSTMNLLEKAVDGEAM